MNAKQRRVLIAVATVVVGMLLYPPHYYPRDSVRGWVTHAYDWLLGGGQGRVEVELLFAQWIAVGIVGAIAYLLSANKK